MLERLKQLSFEELDCLAEEIREQIIEVMSVNGGHLASNLGSIELTIALHRVFNSPTDRFIFDVSHQTYAHKILTGRGDKFHTIRKYDGLCGFAHPKESPHDHYYAGHAGTALSLALGEAKARDLTKEECHICPVIGDAALTCGLTMEALNNVSKSLSRFIIILNDNEMAISQNVGNITRILSRLLSNPVSHKFYQEVERLLKKVPSCGTTLAKQGGRIKDALKNLVSSAPFFEAFNLSYIGPIDGHNIKKMVQTLEALKDSSRPIILHVMTEKGHGMKKASENPITYHGVKPFCTKTGAFHSKPSARVPFPKIFGKAILDMADKDPHILALTPAMPKGSALDAFMERYPDRCLDVGIAEGHCVTYAGALAKNPKLKVVACIYATFLQRGFDNLFHDVCLQESPVVFALDRGGIAGADGSTHNGIYDLGFLRSMPNMIIAQPRNGQLLVELLQEAFSWKKPSAIRYPNVPTDPPSLPLQNRPLGKGEMLIPGSSVVIISLGHTVETAQKVRALLLERDIEPTLVDPIFIKPFDEELFQSILETHTTIVTIEEHSLQTGLGALIDSLAIKYRAFSDRNFLHFGVPEKFVEHGTFSELYHDLGLSPEMIAEKILTLYSESSEKITALST